MKLLRSLHIVSILLGVALFCGGCTKQVGQVRKRHHISRADKAFRTGKYAEAEIQYLKALQIPTLMRSNSVLQGKLGLTYLEEGKAGLALSQLAAPGVSNAAPVEFSLGLARCLMLLGSPAEAQARARWVLSQNPKSERAMLILGESASPAMSGQLLKLFQVLPKEAQELPAYPVALGLIYLMQTNFPQAKNLFEAGLQKKPIPEAYLGLAKIAELAGDAAAAEADLKKAIESSDVRSLVRLQSARLKVLEYQVHGDAHALSQAVDICATVTNKAPEFVPAFQLLAEIALVQKNATNAIGFLDKVLSLDPYLVLMRSVRGEQLLRITNGPAALRDFQLLTGFPRSSASAWYGLARAQNLTHQPAQALASVTRAITLVSNELVRLGRSAELYTFYRAPILLQAELNLQFGKPEAALASLLEISRIFTNDAQTKLLLGDAYAATGNTNAAVLEFTQIIHSTNIQAQLNAAIRLGLMIKTNEALAAWKDLLREAPTDSGLHYFAGIWARSQLRDFALAREWFANARALDTNLDLSVNEQLAEVDLGEGLISNAVTRIEKALGSSQKPELWFRLGIIHLEAAEILLAPSNSVQNSAWTRYSKNSAALEELKQAERPLQKAMETAAREVETNQALTNVYLNAAAKLMGLYISTERLGDALAVFEQIRKPYPKFAALSPVPFMAGQYYDEKRNPEAAIKAYQKAFEANPNHFGACNNLALTYIRLGRPELALPYIEDGVRILRTAVQQNATQPDLTYYLALLEDTSGYVLYKLGKATGRSEHLDRAVKDISSALSRTVADPRFAKFTLQEMYLHLGMTQYLLGRTLPAVEALERALQEDATSPELEEGRACLALLKLDPAKAGSKAKEQVELRLRAYPNDSVALKLRGHFQLVDGAFDKAAASYEAALKIAGDPQTMLTLAELYSTRLQKPDRAREWAEAARKLAPENAQVARLLGKLLLETGNYTDAASLLQEAADTSSDPETFFDLGRAKYSIGRVDEAQRALLAAEQGFKSKPSTNANEAAQYSRFIAAAKDPVKAVSAQGEAQKVVASHPDDLPALMVLGVAQESKGDRKAAAQTLQRALAKYRQFTPAMRRLAFLYEKLGDQQQAWDWATRAREAYPDDNELTKLLGVLAYGRKDYSSATRFLEDAGRNTPEDPEIAFYAGMSFYQLRQNDFAKRYLALAAGTNALEAKLKSEAVKILAQLK